MVFVYEDSDIINIVHLKFPVGAGMSHVDNGLKKCVLNPEPSQQQQVPINKNSLTQLIFTPRHKSISFQTSLSSTSSCDKNSEPLDVDAEMGQDDPPADEVCRFFC